MTKSELIDQLMDEYPHLRKSDIDKIVKLFFDQIIDALSKGDRIELRGFGTFSARKREARVARNPRNGEQVNVSAKFVPHFKAGKAMKAKLNAA